MKKTLSSISFLAVLCLMLSACSKEIADHGNDETKEYLTFTIAIPKKDPVKYASAQPHTQPALAPMAATRAAIHTSDEYQVETLWMYEFNVDGSRLMAEPINIKPELQGVGPEYTYTRTITTADKSSRRFVFVANEQPAGISKANNSSLTDLQNLLAQKTLATSGTSKDLLQNIGGTLYIPMTGEAVQGGQNIIAVTGNTAPIVVALTRIVARIDITNRVPNLLITSVTLQQTNSHSNLFVKNNFAAPTASTKVDSIGTFAALPASFGQNVELTKAFYLYEGGQPSEAGATHIVIKADYKTRKLVYTIPFWKDGAEVVVKRNHIYRIVLGDGTPITEPNTRLRFSIQDTPWNEMLLNEIYQPLYLKYELAGDAAYDDKTRVLSISAAAHANLNFTVETEFANHTNYQATVAQPGQWLTATINGNVLTVSSQANDTGKARAMKVAVRSSADANTVYSFTVEQAAQ